MTERSYESGKRYQRKVKDWLQRTTFLGFAIGLFGDAYDATSRATTIGGSPFDVSLRLLRGEEAHRILYVECKYRGSGYPTMKTEFTRFLEKVHEALANAPRQEVNEAEFCFITNVPPADWREFLRDGRQYCASLLADHATRDSVQMLCDRTHVLVVSSRILGME